MKTQDEYFNNRINDIKIQLNKARNEIVCLNKLIIERDNKIKEIDDMFIATDNRRSDLQKELDTFVKQWEIERQGYEKELVVTRKLCTYVIKTALGK